MAAMGVAAAPGWRSTLQEEPLLARIENLETYLRETPPRHDHERMLLLWASTRLPGLLDEQRRRELVDIIWRQQRDDGGWSTRTFATPEALGSGKRSEELRAEPDYQNPPSDGYQTGLAVVVLRDAGTAADDPRIRKAIRWLLSNQRESGRWWTRSLNTHSRFHYISYSGTAYAALALAKCGALAETSDFGD
ncbi:MAG: terpene cyclase/mutase family protein [Planctomycetes bacterium]|nr:terpene cyclase/mutase family protein [Planctomycetota bacterium]MBL7044928.1 terpene cyclase/mutase family protein [Pirellulaceae bacterium]